MDPCRHAPSSAALRRIVLLGFTLLELLISMAIMGTLARMATIGYKRIITETRTNVVETDLRNLQSYLTLYLQENGALPDSLDDLGMGKFVDPWGNPYQYQPLDSAPKGKWRKDRFLVPLNSDYDLWSMGPDGKSVPPLTSKHSRDDIIRANDGAYIGVATNY